MPFVGADTGQLRSLADDLSRRSKDLTGDIIPGISGRLAGNPWHGPDRQQFDHLWNSQLVHKINNVAAALEDAARTVRKNADDQDRASNDDGTGLGFRLDGIPQALFGGASEWAGGGGNWDKTWGVENFEVSHTSETLFVSESRSADLSEKGFDANYSVEAGLYHSHSNAELSIGDVDVKAESDLFVGATSDNTAHIGADGVSLGTDNFVGARLTGEASAAVDGVAAKVKGEAWAGYGVSASVDAGISGGKLKVKADMGAAFGVGGKIGIDVDVDVGKVANDLGKNVGNFFSSFGGK